LQLQLIEEGFLIQKSSDEETILKLRMKLGTYLSSASLVIAPTLDCNFNCMYCFQDHLKTYMDEKIQKKILTFVPEFIHKKKKLHVCWFGGEPLLPRSLKIIDNMSYAIQEICKEKDCKYSASTSTNGYYLTQETAQKLFKHKINSVQITLDGPPEIHNKRRALTDGKDTFDTILNNIEKTIDIIPISLRINIDHDNYLYVEDLFHILESKNLIGRFLTLDIAMTEPIKNKSFRYFDNKDFNKAQISLYQTAKKYGFQINEYVLQLVPVDIHCTALSDSHLSIAPDGYLYKCRNVFGNTRESIGHIDDIFSLNQKKDQWLNFNPYNDAECKDCKILPLCLGGCAYSKLYNQPTSRKCLKFHFEERLSLLSKCYCGTSDNEKKCVDCY